MKILNLGIPLYFISTWPELPDNPKKKRNLFSQPELASLGAASSPYYMYLLVTKTSVAFVLWPQKIEYQCQRMVSIWGKIKANLSGYCETKQELDASFQNLVVRGLEF